jgi:hypothetical protein
MRSQMSSLNALKDRTAFQADRHELLTYITANLRDKQWNAVFGATEEILKDIGHIQRNKWDHTKCATNSSRSKN